MLSREEFMREANRLAAEHGTVPPPWVLSDEPIIPLPRSEQLQFLINVFCTWWYAQPFTEEEQIAYFRKWPDPPVPWFDFRSLAIWPPIHSTATNGLTLIGVGDGSKS
jgi:hypothetical protein